MMCEVALQCDSAHPQLRLGGIARRSKGRRAVRRLAGKAAGVSADKCRRARARRWLAVEIERQEREGAQKPI